MGTKHTLSDNEWVTEEFKKEKLKKKSLGVEYQNFWGTFTVLSVYIKNFEISNN